jgi:hypothetical protein
MLLDDDGVPLPDRRIRGKKEVIIIVYTTSNHGQDIGKTSENPVYFVSKPGVQGG